MKHEYRIKQTDQGFAVYDRWGVRIDVYKTEDDARKEVDEWSTKKLCAKQRNT